MSLNITLEKEPMGRVVVEALVENLKDVWDAERGLLQTDKVRRLEIADALVDTDASTLALPTRYIRQLGLKKTRDRTAVSAHGSGSIGDYEAVRLTIQGRDCVVEVMELPDEVPPLIGQIPLEFMDWVVDPKNRCLIGNPAHGGEQVFELY